ncbi:bacillithiol biosynthesis cysteine-adding enzyme BshC [Staphylococcus petrasii]|uniref:Putative cysteine ligase BshC n=1 Tax=Staphylococcus petrasii TaxID=1276936 RepID=A0A380G118_9STAP|nr:bacillithiol biosynthesis cysteine-adding enzyme BshC [Staphylococcus petrasii]PNZ26202.1 bacillithiol biosynthesis cysteine-adding enzyme BshC [Staphylococcus petrasii]TGE12563.1 bacillithiol biosynthesis cysteine-adding enzyme BshC [Staphylococcus petrasii]TGE18434.1 bacillithiol biosynthesis cysteine-adding enzyme BshC [Staphylococcus petrasii]SUM44472.1 bacillithiol biosynthesis cysteine-adding enzyme BshC [Staphylococcus petrasii]
MDCQVTYFKEKDSFITKLKNSDEQLLKFYQYNPTEKASFDKRMKQPSNGREQELSQIIASYMEDLKLSDAQQRHLEALSDGAKVVIGGQQAGLFGGPLYTFHKILSIVTLSHQLSQTYDRTVVPVFWIAGEDHDFDEVNHTYVFNAKEAQLHKVKYHTMTPPETNVSRYSPDKEALVEALKSFFKELKETEHTKSLYSLCSNIIDQYDSWTDMFKALLHEVFKEYGVLFIDAQYEALRELEKPILKEMIQHHEEIDQAFRNTQAQTTQSGLNQMIQTDTNVHLFLHEDNMRQLLSKEGDNFKLSKSEVTYSKEEILKLIETESHRFSNNVVTRPVMEEWLFNTVAFIGGPSEIKYWAELNEVFKLLNIEMPIVMPRLKMTYMTQRTDKLLKQYQLDVQQVIENGIEEDRSKFVREKASESFIKQVEKLKEDHARIYQQLLDEVKGNQDNINLVEKNSEIHNTQYDYLLQRYLLNIERENDISMKHFRELEYVLHPMGGLQERIWNPLQIMNEFGIDVFSPSTYPPLEYTFNQIIIKP